MIDPTGRKLFALALALVPACVTDPMSDPGASARAGGAAPDEPLADTLVDDGIPMTPHEVRVCLGGAYPTIQAGFEAVAPHGTVHVCPGTYDYPMSFDKPVHILATGGPEVTFLERPIAVWPNTSGGDGWVIVEGFSSRGMRHRCTGGSLRLVGAVVSDADQHSPFGEVHGGGLDAVGCRIELDDVTFVGNRVSDDGGGARLVDSVGSIRNSRFLDNCAGGDGGGLAVHGGSITVADTEFRGNVASSGGAAYFESDVGLDRLVVEGNRSPYGAGLFFRGGAPRVTDVVVRDNDGTGVVLHDAHITWARGEITGNTGGTQGTGMAVWESTGTVEDLAIRDNTGAYEGGGIRIAGSAIDFRRLDVRRNAATRFGGGILQTHDDRSSFTDTVVAENRAQVGGGMLVRYVGAAPGVASSMRFERNEATDGGALAFAENTPPVGIAGFVFDDNVATRRGGAIYTVSTELTVRNARFAGNRAAAGGAIWAGANPNWDPCDWLWDCPPVPAARPLRVELSTLAGNAAADGAAIWIEGPALAVRGAILADNAGASQVAVRQAPARDGVPNPFPTVTWTYTDTFPATFSGMPDPTGADGNLAAPPGFVDGAARDYRLAPGSVCIDAGPPEMLDGDGTRADMGRFGGL